MHVTSGAKNFRHGVLRKQHRLRWDAQDVEDGPEFDASATVQPAFEQARLSPTAHHFEIRSRFSPTFARNRHLFAMNPMTCDGGNNCSGTAPQLPGNERQVNLFNRAGRELSRKLDVRKIILCHRQATACFLIQSMNDPWSLLPADPGKIFAMRSKALTNVPRLRPAPGEPKSRRFVYHNQVVVFEQNGERDFFRARSIACFGGSTRTMRSPARQCRAHAERAVYRYEPWWISA